MVLPLILFVALAYPVLEKMAEKRLPLVSAHYLSRQLRAAISYAESRNSGLPVNYGSIITEYGNLPSDARLKELEALSASNRTYRLGEALLTAFILWRKNLPYDFLYSDPISDIRNTMKLTRMKERRADAVRRKIVSEPLLGYLKHQAPSADLAAPVLDGLPPDIISKGLVFCGERIPLEREDVRRRIEYQLEYLLSDFRETTGIWLKRKDRYAGVVRAILKRERVPGEFALLPALESGFHPRIVSPSNARGWWQFVKKTAVNSLARENDLNWTLKIDKQRDERCDLALSTRSAARYLKWMSRKLMRSLGLGSWLTVAAAYNAGLSSIQFRIDAYKTSSYWDMKLPLETEEYVPRWIALAIIDSHRGYYGMEVPQISPMQFDTIHGIRLKKDLPLSVLATLTQSSVRFIREINGAVQDGETVFRATPEEHETSLTIHVPGGWKKPVLKVLKARSYLRNAPAGPIRKQRK